MVVLGYYSVFLVYRIMYKDFFNMKYWSHYRITLSKYHILAMPISIPGIIITRHTTSIGNKNPCVYKVTMPTMDLRPSFFLVMTWTRTRFHNLLSGSVVVFVEFATIWIMIVIVTNSRLHFQQMCIPFRFHYFTLDIFQ